MAGALLNIRFEVNGLASLMERLAAVPEVMRMESDRAMLESLPVVEADVAIRTPIVSGRLITSLQTGFAAYGMSSQGTVSTDVPYAPFVEDGRGPVEARPGHMLRFRGRGGSFIFRKRVGAAAGRHMFREGLDAALPRVKELFLRAAERAAASIAGK
jgi:hypothetical protein